MERFEQAVTPRTKLLMLTNPNNPTGHLATPEELRGIARFAEHHDLLVISDDSYERMVYDGRQHVSFASLDGLGDRAITVQSFTKSYAMPGWRVGYVIAPRPFVDLFLKVHEWMILSCGYIEQKAAAAAMSGPQDWVDAIRTHFESSRDAMCGELEGAEELSFVRPEGGPFVFLNVSRCGKPSPEFSKYVLDEYGVRSEPGEVFEGPGYIRLAFGTEDVAEAARAAAEVVGAARELVK
jgi:aspartate/methionine/tyrosine aminotransferase